MADVKLLWVLIPLILQGCWWQKPEFAATVGTELSHSDLDAFRMTEENIDGEVVSRRFTKGEQILLVRAQPVSKGEESRFVTDREFLLMSMYKSRRIPYPGAISSKVECGEDQQPRKLTIDRSGAVIAGWLLWANNRFIFGACAPEEQKYRSIYALVVCQDKRLGYEIKLFAPREQAAIDLSQFLSKFRCTP